MMDKGTNNTCSYLMANPAIITYTCMCPGAKVRLITREARYYAKTHVRIMYAIISRAHTACAMV